MSTTSEPHLACYHEGEDFDWWRCNTKGYVGRPPSPFPAPFEVQRKYLDDPMDRLYFVRSVPDPPAVGDSTTCPECIRLKGCSGHNVDGLQDDDEARRKLYWPMCQGPEPEPMEEDLGDMNLNDGLSSGKKTPRLPYKRPPWIPAKMPNKWGLAGHPPPYTNYCKETLFNTRTADPKKITIKKTF